ncbi:MAG: hypothetical protein R2942_10415 [Ignavibacteria bacterium]
MSCGLPGRNLMMSFKEIYVKSDGELAEDYLICKDTLANEEKVISLLDQYDTKNMTPF